VRLKATPGTSRTAVGAVTDGAVLKVQVTAAPEDGKANAAILKALAKAWRLPKSRLAIAAGALMQHFKNWMERHHA
jgi:uncharacterized protein YggU (UPF0235/DUF167 family)